MDQHLLGHGEDLVWGYSAFKVEPHFTRRKSMKINDDWGLNVVETIGYFL